MSTQWPRPAVCNAACTIRSRTEGIGNGLCSAVPGFGLGGPLARCPWAGPFQRPPTEPDVIDFRSSSSPVISL